MFYQERIMDGRLWYRSTPDGQWQEVEPNIILGRMILAEQNLNKALAELERMRGNRYIQRG